MLCKTGRHFGCTIFHATPKKGEEAPTTLTLKVRHRTLYHEAVTNNNATLDWKKLSALALKPKSTSYESLPSCFK